MRFKVLTVYKDENGQQVLFNIIRDDKFATDLDLSELISYFNNRECVNATLIGNRYVQGKGTTLVSVSDFLSDVYKFFSNLNDDYLSNYC